MVRVQRVMKHSDMPVRCIKHFLHCVYQCMRACAVECAGIALCYAEGKHTKKITARMRCQDELNMIIQRLLSVGRNSSFGIPSRTLAFNHINLKYTFHFPPIVWERRRLCILVSPQVLLSQRICCSRDSSVNTRTSLSYLTSWYLNCPVLFWGTLFFGKYIRGMFH